MKNEENKLQDTVEKKQWITPQVVIINTDNITSGSVFDNNEGGSNKSFTLSGALTHATYFS